MMPPEISPPEPLLVTEAGTSLLGLNPTATSVPGGDSANLTNAACVENPTASPTDRIPIAFIVLFIVFIIALFVLPL
jgi:hypothetical protein